MTEGKIKYVRLGTRIMLFSGDIAHRDAARGLTDQGFLVHSAGFVEFTDDGPQAYGDSESLGRESLPEDSEWITKELGIKNSVKENEAVLKESVLHALICLDDTHGNSDEYVRAARRTLRRGLEAVGFLPTDHDDGEPPGEVDDVQF